MKLCLLFHCLCESYDEVPDHGQDMFVTLADIQTMIEELSARGYSFGSLDNPGSQTVTITFDDGYYNNLLFGSLAQSYGIPYLIFISAYYNLTGEAFPWFLNKGHGYSDPHLFDYYQHYGEARQHHDPVAADQIVRPMTFSELDSLKQSALVEIGCHGYYHQPLSGAHERYLEQERDLALACLEDGLGIKPRYFSLANGMYTKRVVRELLKTFDRVLTIDGRPFHRNDQLVHRITLLNPEIAGPLIQQVDRHLNPLRKVRRAVRTFARTRW